MNITLSLKVSERVNVCVGKQGYSTNFSVQHWCSYFRGQHGQYTMTSFADYGDGIKYSLTENKTSACVPLTTKLCIIN